MYRNILENIWKREGTCKGFLYEMQIIFLFMIRACLNKINFTLVNNVEGFGNFDDLVAMCELEDGAELLICLQSKHLKESEYKIDLSKFKGKEKDENDKSFKLKKYHDEIVKSKISNYKDINVKFIFYTTVAISETDTDLQWCNIDNNDILCLLLNTSAGNNRVRRFSMTGNEKILREIANDKTFLEKICIFSNQSHESDFDKIIKYELEKLLGTENEDVINKIFTQLKDSSLEWYKYALPFDNNKFLDNVWNFLAKEMPCFSTCEDTMYEMLSHIYNDNNIAPLQKVIEDNQIVIVKTVEMSTALPAIVVYKAVSNITSKCVRKPVFVKLQNLRKVLILYKNIMEYLIIEVDCAVANFKNNLEMLYDILDQRKWKKVVFLVPNFIEFDIPLQNVKVVDYVYKFDLLSSDTQKYILSCNINFQGHEMPLSELIDTKNDSCVLDYETVEKLIRHKTVNIGEELKRLPKEIEHCYIPRSFHCTNAVSSEVFDMKSNSDVLLISVTSADHLCKYKRHFVLYESIDKNNEYCGIFYHIRHSKEGDDNVFEYFAAKLEEKNVHWLEEREHNLVWLDTKGSVENIQKYVQTCTLHEGIITQQGVSESILLENDKKLNVLVDSAGKGKTTILYKIAEQLKLKNKGCWVLHYDLNSTQMFGILYELSENKHFNQMDAKQLVFKYFLTNCTQLEISVFNVLLEKSKIYFCFDGLDEISPRYENIFIALLKKLNQSSAKQIWLTSGEHMEKSLQNNFPVFPIKLLDISIEDQINFCVKYYTFELNKGEICKKEIEHLSKKLIESISSANATILEFMGIPLLTKMLALINLEQCKKYLNNTHEQAKLPMTFENIFDLYQIFFENAIKRYLTEKKYKVSEYPKLSLEKKLKKYQKLHMSIATRSLLPEHYSKLITEQEEPDKLTSDLETKLLGIGILTSLKTNNVKFLHFTFAEFFLANLLLVNLSEIQNPSELQIILDDVLYNDRWKAVRKLLNSSNLLAENLSNLKYNPTAKYIREIEETSLIIALKEGNRNIVRCILQCLRGVNKADAKTWICQYRYKHEKPALYIAIENGYAEEVFLLLEKGANKEEDIGYYGSPLTYAIRQGNLEIIRLLVYNGANIHQRAEFNKTAIIVAASSSTPEVLDLLLHLGASLEDKGMCEVSLLIFAAMNKRNYTLVHVLGKRQWDVNYKDSQGNTALHKAADYAHILNIKTLLDYGADINSQNRWGQTPLHLALTSDRYPESSTQHQLCAKYLIKRGARIDITLYDGKTALESDYLSSSTLNDLREWLEKDSEHDSVYDLEQQMKNYDPHSV